MTKILFIDGDKIRALDAKSFADESKLQAYLEKYPELVPLEDVIEEASELICIGREVSVPSGAMDLLFVDKKGLLTIVETKLVSNPQVRREVVGQVIEYASYVAQWTVDKIYEVANTYIKSDLDDYLLSRYPENFSAEDFRANVEENLEKGRIRLIVAVDKLIEPLRQFVNFLNSHSDLKILLLEVSSFEGKANERVLAPSIFGYISKSNQSNPSTRRHWDKISFFDDVKKRDFGATTVNTINQLFEFSETNAESINWGTGALYGSFTFRKFGASIFTVQSDGRMYLSFGGMIGKVKEDTLRFFIKSLNEIRGFKIPQDAATKNVYPYLKVEVLSDTNSLEAFRSSVLTLGERGNVKEQI